LALRDLDLNALAELGRGLLQERDTDDQDAGVGGAAGVIGSGPRRNAAVSAFRRAESQFVPPG
jgi:hypothetical protein